jgi:glutathione reductase (NADPH)
VAIVEGDRVGGTCVIRGCVPKKLLVYGAQCGQHLKEAASYGWRLEGEGARFRCDPSILLANVRAEVDRLNALHISLLERAEVELIRGWGHFADPHHVEVSAADGSCRRLRGERILIAVGGRPHRPAIPGAELGWVSDDMFLLESLPDHVVVVGAGYIACEFAGILRGLGVAVTQLVRGDQLLRGFDREATAAVQEGMVAQGIELRFAHSPAAIEGVAGSLSVVSENGERFACGGVLLATGRRPFLDGLDLEAAGVSRAGHRVPVSADQATNMPHIFAVGDVTDRINLTPVAVDEGRAFADSVFGQRPREEEAIARCGSGGVRVHRARFRPMTKALPQTGERVLLKLVVESASGKVLGCHMVGEHAAEIIQMAAIAIGMGATKADFDRTMALHPSVAEEFVTMPV